MTREEAMRAILYRGDWEKTAQETVTFLSMNDLLPTPPLSRNILDFGCGIGRVMKPILKRGELRRDYFVVGYDPNPDMIRLAQKELEDYYPNFYLTSESDFITNPTPKKYGLIYAVEVMQHLRPEVIAELITKLRKLLCPGGKLVVMGNAVGDWDATPLQTWPGATQWGIYAAEAFTYDRSYFIIPFVPE